MYWDSVTNGSTNLRQTGTLFPHYFDALNVLFRIENTLRILVYIVLKDELGSKWADCSIQAADTGESMGTIASIAKRRISQASTHGHLGYEISCPIMHLTTGELTSIILAESQWSLFKNHFQAKRDVIRIKFEEITQVRNALAHFRPVKHDDVQLVQTNSRHILAKAETLLGEILGWKSPVPTNTSDEWYKQLTSIVSGTKSVSLARTQDEQWIEVVVPFLFPLKWNENGTQYRFGESQKLNSAAMLGATKNLLEATIFAVEAVRFVHGSESLLPIAAQKDIRFTMSTKRMLKHYAEVKMELSTLIQQINEEAEMVRSDNLARGKFVEHAVVFASLSQATGQWQVNEGAFTRPLTPSDPAEYLGQYFVYQYHGLTSHAHAFPWFPTPICEAT